VTALQTPDCGASLIAAAKRAATPVAAAVTARIPPDHLIGMSRDELMALVIVLAEAADPVTLRDIIAADDDGGEPQVTAADLRYAHAEAARLRRAGERVPTSIRILDNAYHDAGRAARAAAGVVPPPPQVEQSWRAFADELSERRSQRDAA
jgi:hypothetical protein